VGLSVVADEDKKWAGRVDLLLLFTPMLAVRVTVIVVMVLELGLLDLVLAEVAVMLRS
jgi:hypothetical protein